MKRRNLKHAKGRDLVSALVGVGPLAGADGEDLAAAEELTRRELARPAGKADGPRWELTTDKRTCACGTVAGVLRNCRSGSRVTCQHKTPKGKRCHEPIGSVLRVHEAPAGAKGTRKLPKFPGESFAVATEVLRVYSLDQAERLERNIEVTGQPFNRAPVQLELFGPSRSSR